MKDFIYLGLWVLLVGGIFAVLWHKGYWMQLANYVGETKEELKKCTWPTLDELKGSTVAVIITTILIGFFTVGVDFVIVKLVRFIT